MVELALRGYQPAAIARELEIEPRSVQRHIDAALAKIQERLLDKTERMVAQNLMRAERLLKSVAPYALGGEITVMRDGEELLETIYPDRHWGKLYLDILKMENEVHDKIQKAIARRSDDKKGGDMYVDHMEVTLASGGELYQHAQGAMEEDYLTEYLDMDAENLIEGEIIEDQSEMEKRIDELDKTMKLLLPEGDDDDDDAG